MRLNSIICLLLVGITTALYWPAIHFDLVYYDDTLFVTDNPEISSGVCWRSLTWILTGVIAGNWHPVTNLTFLVGHQLWGANPGREHLVSLLIHAGNSALLFLLLNTLTKAAWRSAAVAALFAWHPLRVESVAWVAERKDVLSAFFFFLTLMAYARYATLSQAKIPTYKIWYGWSLFFFSLGLMSKPTLVTVPFVLLLLDVWPLKRVGQEEFALSAASMSTRAGVKRALPTLGKLLLEKCPFFVLSLILSVITYLVQQTYGSISSLQRTGFDPRIENVILSYVRYLGKTIWPSNLAALYPFPTNAHSYLALWPTWQICLVAIAMVLLSCWCVSQIVRRPYLAVGWFWYLGTMIPVIGLVQTGSQGMADRHTYLSLIGPVIAVVWFTSDLFRSRFAKRVMITCVLAVLCSCIWATQKQLNYWRDTVTLFTHTADVTGDNYLAQILIGNGYERQGLADQAEQHYRMAISLYPLDKMTYQSLAGLEEKSGEWAAAATNYDLALDIDPDDTASHLGLAHVLPHLGRTKEAAGHLEAALRGNLDSPDLLNNLAWALATSPENDFRNGLRAVQLAENACTLTHFQNTVMIGTLAAAYAEAGRFDDAIATAQKACANAAAKGEIDLLQRNQALLAFYQKHQAYHEPAEKLVPGAP